MCIRDSGKARGDGHCFFHCLSQIVFRVDTIEYITALRRLFGDSLPAMETQIFDLVEGLPTCYGSAPAKLKDYLSKIPREQWSKLHHKSSTYGRMASQVAQHYCITLDCLLHVRIYIMCVNCKGVESLNGADKRSGLRAEWAADMLRCAVQSCAERYAVSYTHLTLPTIYSV